MDSFLSQSGVGHIHGARPLISVIIPWCNRAELARSLQKNSHLLRSRQYEVLIVHAGGDFGWLKQLVAAANIDYAYLVDIEGASFNKCLCLNVGVWASGGQSVFFLDCDVLLNEDSMASAANALCSGNFITISKLSEENPAQHAQTLYKSAMGIDNSGDPWIQEVRQTWELVFAGNKKASFERWQGTHGRSPSGLMLIQKQDYVAVGGSNSKIEGWGFEDIDLQIRLQAQLGITRCSVGTARHLTHDSPEVRFESEQRNTNRCFLNYCRGEFLGTYSKDISSWERHVRKYIVRGPSIEMIRPKLFVQA